MPILKKEKKEKANETAKEEVITAETETMEPEMEIEETTANTDAETAEDERKTKNSVRLVGTVVNSFQASKGVLVLTLSTNSSTGKRDYPKVAFFGQQATSVKEDLDKAGKYPKVRITGSIQTRRKDVDGNAQYFQGVVGRKFAFAQWKLADSVQLSAGKLMVDDVNEFAVVGKLVNIFNPDNKGNVVVLTVRTNIKRYSFVKSTFFKMPKDILESLAVGQYVGIVGSIQTSSRTTDGDTTYYESAVGKDVAIAD